MNKLNIPEEDSIYFHTLDYKKRLFEKKINVKDSHFTMISDDKIVISNENGIIAEAEWEFLGLYHNFIKPSNDDNIILNMDDNLTYSWVWSWEIFPEPRNLEIKKKLNELPDSCKLLNGNVLKFDDSMVISYILGFLSTHLELDYVHCSFNDGTYSAIGLKNINFFS